jgi:hypothetical protein
MLESKEFAEGFRPALFRALSLRVQDRLALPAALDFLLLAHRVFLSSLGCGCKAFRPASSASLTTNQSAARRLVTSPISDSVALINNRIVALYSDGVIA